MINYSQYNMYMESILIKNPAAVQQKIDKIQSAGCDDLFVVADMNRTLTPSKVNGKKVSTSFSIFRDNDYFSEEYRIKTKEWFAKYNPIEIDDSLDMQYRRDVVSAWFQDHHRYLVEQGITEEIIRQVIKDGNVQLRSGVVELLSDFKESDVPMLIVSGGVGDVARILLADAGVWHSNMDMISNMFTFDADGKATGLDMTYSISHLNKDVIDISHSKLASEISKRSNMIVIGDQKDDVLVAKSIEHKTVLSVGFLNQNEEERREEYMDMFDIVITGDGDVAYLNKLFKTFKGSEGRVRY